MKTENREKNLESSKKNVDWKKNKNRKKSKDEK